MCAGAALRAMAIAGALERVLMQTVEYARTRVQFGKPIASFQAIQQQLAVLAGHTAAAGLAAEAAIADIEAPERLRRSAAVAKIRCGEAAGAVASIAHQVHGAIGITKEHSLHFATRRLWSWRAEFGAESYWAEQARARSGARGRRRLLAVGHGIEKSAGLSPGASSSRFVDRSDVAHVQHAAGVRIDLQHHGLAAAG